MKVETIGIGLSRRSMFEAADLGVRIVGANARSVWRSYLPVHAFAVLLAAAFLPWGIGWSYLFLICIKPWLDRSLLFILARAAFREPTRFADLLVAWREVWWRDLLGTLTIRRLSPWRSYVQPVQQLEGQRGAERRRRIKQVLQNHRGTAFLMQSAFATVESFIAIGLAVLPMWFTTIDDRNDWVGIFYTGSGPWLTGLQFLAYAVAVGVVEPFFVGAGFAMYLNRRVELEAWDIEQEFRVAFAAA
jgi:hypothetical protein